MLRSFRLFSFLGCLLSFSAAPAALGSDGFDPNANGNIYAVLVQPDGKTLIGGSFTQLQPAGLHIPIGRNRIARLHPNGVVDAGFAIHANDDVHSIALQADGKILIGGRFTELHPEGSPTPIARRGLARLNPDGSVDLSFNPNPGGAPLSQAQVYAIAPLDDGRILVGGGFTQFEPHGGAAIARSRLARLNPDGSVDASFDPQPNNLVFAITPQPDGRILIGGGFTQLRPHGGEAIEAGRLARLHADGSVDAPFQVFADNRVLAIALQPDGSMIVGGDFRNLRGILDEEPLQRQFIARVRPDGSIDGDYRPSPSGSVTTLAFQRDGRLLVGGSFTSIVDGTTVANRRYLARLTPLGAVDLSFNAGVNAAVAAVGFQNDGSLVIGGYFSRVQLADAAGSTQRNHLARLHANGSLDADLSADTGGYVNAVTRQPDGRVLVGGYFTSFAGATRNHLVRLSADGTVDPSFTPNLNGPVNVIVLQGDGRILLGGEFTQVNGVTRTYLARLQPDGTLDADFNPNPNNSVLDLFVQSDGRIVLAGGFTTFQPNATGDVTFRAYLARVNSNGTLDTGFNPNGNGVVNALLPQSDGRFIAGGSFTLFQPNNANTASVRSNMARFNADGSLDGNFHPATNGAVQALLAQADGKIILGGAFTSMQPNNATEVTTRNYLARINNDGTLDTAFDPNPNAVVTTLASFSDGSLLVGGNFSSFQPGAEGDAIQRSLLARLNSDGTVRDGFNLNLNDQVYTLVAQPDNTILVGGAFTSAIAGSDYVALAANLLRLRADGSVDTAYRPTPGNQTGAYVSTLALQPDGQIVLGGSFSGLTGGTTANLARFNGTGSPDPRFNVSTDGPVRALLVPPNPSTAAQQGGNFAWLEANGSFRTSFPLTGAGQLVGRVNATAVLPDGKVLLGGRFVNISGQVTNDLNRFHADGSLDTSFDPAPNGPISRLLLQPDGKVLVSGGFTHIGGLDRNRIARFNADGTIDAGFNPNANAQVTDMLLQPDGKILIGGAFTTLQPNGAAEATNFSYVARLNADGSADTAFNPSANGAVNALVLQADGKVVIGGAFTTLQPNNANEAAGRNYIARVNADGTLDTAFNHGPNGPVTALLLQPDGKIVLGGTFDSIQTTAGENATARFYLARLNADSTVDADFNPNPDGQVYTLAQRSDGILLAGGAFTSLRPNATGDSITRNRIVALELNGTVRGDFNPNADNIVYTLLPRPDNSVLVGGAFTSLQPDAGLWVAGEFSRIGNLDLPYLARLNNDGNPDSGFAPAPNAAVYALAPLGNGLWLAGGAFTQIAGQDRLRLARFQADGTLDATFQPSINGPVSAVAVQTDGRILVAGEFTEVNGQPRQRLARLQTDGSLDASFRSDANGAIHAISLQHNGRILVGGEFTSIAGVSRNYLARLQPNGGIDFLQSDLNGAVFTIALQVDGRILIGGRFTTIDGVAQPHLGRLTPQGGRDGSLIDYTDNDVFAIALQSDGRPIVGGAFSTLNDSTRFLIARMAADNAPQMLMVSRQLGSVWWQRRGAGPQITSASFAYSFNGSSWIPLGEGRPYGSSGTWQWEGAAGSLPANANYLIRARGVVPGSRNSSNSVVETVWQFYNQSPAGSRSTVATALDYPWLALGGGFDGDSPDGNPGGDDGSDPGGNPIVIPGDDPDATRLVNLSGRVRLEGSEIIMAGFVLSGEGPKKVVIRGVGPTLAEFEMTDPLVQKPYLRLFDRNGNVVVERGRWASDEASRVAFQAAGAFPLLDESDDAAVVVTLEPGPYTVHFRDEAGQGGVMLAEVYNAEYGEDKPRLVNLSIRGRSHPGPGSFITGFVLEGNEPRRLLVRAAGTFPGGGNDSLQNPKISLFQGDGQGGARLIAENHDWGTPQGVDPNHLPATAAEISAAETKAGAWAYPPGSPLAAVLVNLTGGVYTVHVSSEDGGSGDTLVEIFEILP